MLEKIIIGCLLVASAGALMWFKPWEAGASDLVMEVEYDSEPCGLGKPVVVTIFNYSTQPLTDITYKLSSRLKGTGVPQCEQELYTDVLVPAQTKLNICSTFIFGKLKKPECASDDLGKKSIWKAEPLRARVFKE